MRLPRLRLRPPSWPRRTARLRLTALYGGLFLLCGLVLVAITYLLVKQAIGRGPDVNGLPLAGSYHFAAHGLRPEITVSKQPLRQLEAAVDRQDVAFDLNEMLVRSGIALAIVTVIAVVLGWLAADRALRPLATITATARRISASNLNERLALHGPDDELKDLGDTLDELFARLEASFAAQRRFVANASHELRTPLTEERTLLQVALDDPDTTAEQWRSTTHEVLAVNAEQERLIEALLTLAGGEAGLDHREPIDLAGLAGEVLAASRPEIGRLGLHVQAGTGPAALDGDPLLIERLVANLIDNAVRYNLPGGRVEIATGTGHGRAVLSVTNTGPVIPPSEVGRLFQPFQRLSAHRGHHPAGHGLGLSIVRAIATAHGAAITAQARPGGGLTVDVTFPPAARPGSSPAGAPEARGPARAGAGPR
jgi:signal transduction histidine kinase